MTEEARTARREYMKSYRQRPEVRAKLDERQTRYWQQIYNRMVADGRIEKAAGERK